MRAPFPGGPWQKRGWSVVSRVGLSKKLTSKSNVKPMNRSSGSARNESLTLAASMLHAEATSWREEERVLLPPQGDVAGVETAWLLPGCWWPPFSAGRAQAGDPDAAVAGSADAGAAALSRFAPWSSVVWTLPRVGLVGVVGAAAALPTLGRPSDVCRRLEEGVAREGDRVLPGMGTGVM